MGNCNFPLERYTLQDIDTKFTNKKLEDFFIKEDKLKIQKLYDNKSKNFNKKIFNRSLQELYLAAKKVDLSKETEGNFKQIFDFIDNNLPNTI